MIYKVKSKVEDIKPTCRKLVTPKNFNNTAFNNSYKAWIKRKTKLHIIKTVPEIQEAVNKIFEVAGKLLIERDGGVVLEGIGYFAFYMPMFRRFNEIIRTPDNIIRPFHETEYYNFYPFMFTDIFAQNKLKGWYMDRSFYRPITEDFRLNRRGKKLYYKEVKNIYK